MLLDKRLLQPAQSARPALLLTIALGVIAGVVLVGQAFYLSRVINRVFLAGADLAGVQTYLLLLFGFSLLRAGLTWSSQVTAQRVASRVKIELRRCLAAQLLALGPAYTQGERSGELTNTVVEGVEALNDYFSQYLPQLATAALVPLTILLFVFPLDLLSGLVLLLTTPLIPIFMVLIGQAAESMTQRQWSSLSRMSAHFLDVLQGLTTLKLLGRSREQAEIIAFISNRFRQTTLSVLRVAFLSALVLELVATISTAVVAVQVGLRLLYGWLEFEQALFVLILAPEFYLPLRLLGSRFHAGMSGAAAARRIFEVLETPLPITTADRRPLGLSLGTKPSTAEISHKTAEFLTTNQPTNHPSIQLTIHPPIQFNEVHYSYDAAERPALRGVSFTIEPGQKVALVGPSGAGKSTVAHLLLRFIDPTAGVISVAGRPLATIEPATWRAQLAWVPQQPYLFHASVADNIRLSRPEAAPADVVRAAQLAQADRFIASLPAGYDTLIGERGARLSGGQAQRLALARAFLKDAPILILDEATANLDPEQEAEIQAAIERLLRRRTALIIAHRLNTVRNADKIVVLDNGLIQEAGTHTALMEQQGLYHQLVVTYQTGLSPNSPQIHTDAH